MSMIIDILIHVSNELSHCIIMRKKVQLTHVYPYIISIYVYKQKKKQTNLTNRNYLNVSFLNL